MENFRLKVLRAVAEHLDFRQVAESLDLTQPAVTLSQCVDTTRLRDERGEIIRWYATATDFHWHMTGQHFRDYHLLLDEHSEQIFAMTDDIAERARKIGGTTLRSISDISRHQRLKDNNDETVAPKEMLAELSADNQALTRYFRSAHETCDKYNDVATASLIEVWIDQTERRTWFLSKSCNVSDGDLFEPVRQSF